MKLTLSPVRGLPGQPETTLSVVGDVPTVNGVAYDLSVVPEGGTATPDGDDHPFIGPITRSGGEIACTVRVILGDTATADQPAAPEHWVIAQASGVVAIPATRNPNPEVSA